MAWIRCTGNTGGSLKVRAASGRIATFETNMVDVLQEVKCEINPTQDLHGYDHVWAAGAGKNKLFLTTPEGIYTRSGITYKVNADGTVETSGTATADDYLLLWNKSDADNNKLLPDGNYVLNGCPSGGSNTTFYIATNGFGGNSDTGSGGNLPIDSSLLQTNILISVKNGTNMNGKVFKPMIRLSSVSDSTYEPYSNICPINGYSSANITRCGVNLLNLENSEQGGIDASGVEITSTFSWRANALIRITPGVQYTLSVDTSNTYIARLYFYDSNGNFISPRYVGNNNTVTATAPSNAKYCKWVFYTNADTTLAIIRASQPQLETGVTRTAYHAYNGQTYTIAFGQTVYGGVLDATRGKLTVTWTGVNLGSLTWSYITSGTVPRFQAPLPTTGKGSVDNAHEADLICSNYTNTSWANVTNLLAYNGYIAEVNNGGYITIHDDNYTDAPTFKTAMNSVMIAYELATPFDIDLTPVQINALALPDSNNVFTDCGQTTVKYLKRE